MKQMDPKIQRFFAQLPDHKMKLAMQVRDIFLSADEKITEAIKWNQLTFIYRGNLAFIYSLGRTDYINLGFWKAVQLRDPKKLLEGTGKGMRHLKIRSEKDISARQIRAWAREAMTLNEAEK
jgi:hypothetical protein